MQRQAIQQAYPVLHYIIAAFLHQDYDIEGPELEDAVQAFISRATPEQIKEGRADIARFLTEKAEHLQAALEELTDGDYASEPGMPARDYLLWLDGLLAGALEHNGQHV
ncbi:MAG: contact-dependent growth inhibition system immunity protein [Azospirillaceae bacterium]|nr:contact-dependent growth inhibition system immunity protein [Azospirillaceae bacterium]